MKSKTKINKEIKTKRIPPRIKLTAKQKKRADEYIKTDNKAEATRRAYPKVKNAETASVM
jgi:hypothetical protein